MKKNLFYLFALICSMSLFTACSSDDEPWQELPSGEITPEKVDLKLNGETTTGTVNFTATGAEAAKVELKNVIDGYSDVNVNVTMKEQADGSFSFKGKESIATKPVTREVATPVPFLVVTLEGTISKDGKMVMDVTAEGIGLYLGTYSGETLSLTYNGNVLSDGAIVLDATSGDNVSILLQGVLPGDAAAVLSNIVYDGKNFNGTSVTDFYTVKLTGTRADKKLTLNVESTLTEEGQGGLAGKWNLVSKLPMTEMGTLATAPLYITWSAKNDSEMNFEDGANAITVFMGTGVMYNLLDNVTFNEDGNITANYNSTKELGMDVMMGYMGAMGNDEEGNTILLKQNENWINSPKNLVNWYTKDGLLYVVPNIAAIMQQVATDNGGESTGSVDLTALLAKLGAYNINVSALLPYITEWMSTGIPLKYAISADGLKIYVDKVMAAPFIEALLPALPALQSQIEAILADPEQEETAGLINMVFYMCGIELLTDIQTIWENNTDELEIALNLVK